MSSVRLNKTHKREIRQLIIDNRFEEEQKKMRELQNSVFLKLHGMLLKKWFGKHLEAALAMPQELWATRSSIKINLGGMNRSINYYVRKGEDRKFIFPHKFSEHYNRVNLAPGTKEFKLVDDYLQKADALEIKINETISDVDGVLSCFSTDNALIKSWPEIEKYVRKVIPANSGGKVNLPSVPVAKLNEILKLP